MKPVNSAKTSRDVRRQDNLHGKLQGPNTHLHPSRATNTWICFHFCFMQCLRLDPGPQTCQASPPSLSLNSVQFLLSFLLCSQRDCLYIQIFSMTQHDFSPFIYLQTDFVLAFITSQGKSTTISGHFPSVEDAVSSFSSGGFLFVFRFGQLNYHVVPHGFACLHFIKHYQSTDVCSS